MSRVKIFVDTGADITKELREQYDIDMIHYNVVFGDTSYVAGVEITNAEFYEKLLASDKLPTTSQTSPGDIYDAFSAAAKECDAIVYFTISSKASGQYNNALMNAEIVMEENPNVTIKIVDTMTFSLYISETAIRLRQYLNDGMELSEAIEKSLEFIKTHKAYITVDTLKFLEKGGRINKTTAVVGSLLDIKPVLTVKDGLIASHEKIRGKKKIYNKLIDIVRETPGFDENETEFYVIDSCTEYGDKLEEALKEEFGDDSVKRRYEFGPIIGTHTGNGAVAVLFKVKGE